MPMSPPAAATAKRLHGRLAVLAAIATVVLLVGMAIVSWPNTSRPTPAPPTTAPTTTDPDAGQPGDDPPAGFSLPAEAEVLQGLREGHPRLMVTPSAVLALRERVRIDPTTAAMYAQVEERAVGLLDEPVLTYEKPDGRRLLRTSRAALQRIYDLGLVWLVDQDPAVAARGAAELMAVSAFADWNPVHFLDTAEMSHAVAIGYDWLHAALTPPQRTTAREALVSKGLEPARAAYAGTAAPQSSPWVSYDYNWAVVTNAGVALGALAVGDEEPELARTVLHQALTRLAPAMENYAPDGGWPEGVGYWGYATDYAGYLVGGLDTALGTDFGLSTMAGFAVAGDFPAHLTGATGQHYNWGDDVEPGYPPPAPYLFWTAERFGRPQDRSYQLTHRKPAALDVVWYRPSDPPATEPPLDKLFTGTDVATLRGSWGDPSAWWVGTKGGRPWVNHNQLDAGSFVLDALGERWAIDLGAEDYDVPGYWNHGPGGLRWNYFRSRAESHNTLVLDPDRCEDQDPTATSIITRFRSGADGAFTITNLTGAYRGTPVRRGIGLFDGRRHVVVQDELNPTESTDLWWLMHTRARIALSDDRRTALLTQDGKVLRASLVGLPKAAFSVTPAAPMPASPEARNSDNPDVRRLTINTSVSGPTSFAVVFDDGSHPVPTALTPLGRWQVDGAGVVAQDRRPVTAEAAPNACKGVRRPGGD
jgi:hypothetical protein